MASTRSTRPKGRPPKGADGTNLLSRKIIITRALDLARSVPLPEVSVVALSQSLGVSAPAIHHHIGTRDKLTSAILNHFYQLLCEKIDKPRLKGRSWMEHFAKTFLSQLLTYRGVAIHLVSQNRHRVFQLVEDGETDYGKEFLYLVMQEIVNTDVSDERTGVFLHLLLQHIVSTAHAIVAKMLPADNAVFLYGQFDDDPEIIPRSIFDSFARTDGELAFDEGLKMLLDYYQID